MLNHIVIVGRLVNDPVLKELEDGKKVTNITLAVPRNYKNEDGEYDADYFSCALWGGLASNTYEYCKKGDMVGIKGRMKSNLNKENKYSMEVVAEKVTFLSSKKNINPEEIVKNDIEESIPI